jgi:hypothetical protein
MMVSIVLSGCFSTDDGDGSSELSYQGFALSADKDGKDSFNMKVDPKPLFEDGKEAFEAAKLPYDDEVDVEEKPGLLPLPIDENEEKLSRMVIISWGRGQAVSKKHDVRIWMGGIRADLAHIRAHRLVDFEDNDVLIRDQQMNRVTFSTQTRDRMDGVLLRVSSKSRADVKNGHLSFQTIGFNHLIALSDIFSGKQITIPVDRAGNVLTVRSIRRRAACPHGFMKARWDRVDKRGGIFRGLLMADEGEGLHKVAGVWGKAGGAYRFKGFVLNSNGNTKGILRGTFQPSETEGLNYASYRGHILNRDGEVIGKVRGVFTTPTDGPGAGYAKGLWKVRCAPEPEACNDEVVLPAPKPLACVCKPNVTEVAPKEKPELTAVQADEKVSPKTKPAKAAAALEVSADEKPLSVKPLDLAQELDASDANCFCKLPLPKPTGCVANDADQVEVKPEPTEVKPKPALDDEANTDVKPKPAQDEKADSSASAFATDKG